MAHTFPKGISSKGNVVIHIKELLKKERGKNEQKISEYSSTFHRVWLPDSSPRVGHVVHATGSGQTSAGHVSRYTDRLGCFIFGASWSGPPDMDTRKPAFMSRALTPAFLEPQRTIPEALTPSGRAWLIASRLRCPFLKECWGIFGAVGRVWATALRPDPP